MKQVLGHRRLVAFHIPNTVLLILFWSLLCPFPSSKVKEMNPSLKTQSIRQATHSKPFQTPGSRCCPSGAPCTPVVQWQGSVPHKMSHCTGSVQTPDAGCHLSASQSKSRCCPPGEWGQSGEDKTVLWFFVCHHCHYQHLHLSRHKWRRRVLWYGRAYLWIK